MFLQRAAPSLVRPSRTLLSQQAAWSEVQHNGRRHCGPPISACACMQVPEDWPTRSPRGRAAAPADIAPVRLCAASRPPAREPGPARPRAAAAAPSPAVSACRYQSAPHTAACHGWIMSVRARGDAAVRPRCSCSCTAGNLGRVNRRRPVGRHQQHVGGAARAFMSHLSDDRSGAHSWHSGSVPRRRCIGQWRWRGARMLMGVAARSGGSVQTRKRREGAVTLEVLGVRNRLKHHTARRVLWVPYGR